MFKIFQKLGGEEKSLDLIEEAEGRRPSKFVLADWHRYGRIPAIRAVILLDECQRRGIPATYEEDCVDPDRLAVLAAGDNGSEAAE